MISLLFYTHNTEHSLEKNLNTLIKFFDSESYEYIFVDDFSDDDSFDILYKFIKNNFINKNFSKTVKLLRQDEYRGRGRAIQWGLGNVNHDIVVIINLNNLAENDIQNIKEKIDFFISSNRDANIYENVSIYKSNVIKNFWIKTNGETVEAEIFSLLNKKKNKVFSSKKFTVREHFTILKTNLRPIKKSFKSL